ncbi:MAG: hypothetical protein KDK70_43045 [Myxococcales bacterium]|nr:hypothetical protein [Myxococcales bacterium]
MRTCLPIAIVLLMLAACGQSNDAADAAKGLGGAMGELPAAKVEASSAPKARDAATGLPTGKRQHKPLTIAKEPDAAASHEITSPRDPASGQATGKALGAAKPDAAMNHEVTSPRDAASGLPTGKR